MDRVGAGRRGGARLLRLAARVAWGAVGCAVLVLPSAAECAERTSPAVPRPDVIVVLLDTYRFDHLGENVGRDDLTPNLDAFARGAIRFARAFSPSNVTNRAMPGVLTSLPASVTGQRLPEEAELLAEFLREAGYATLGISANPNVSKDFGYGQGFDVFLDPTDQADFLIVNPLQLLSLLLPGSAYAVGISKASFYYPPFDELRRRARWLLGRASRPTLLYLQTMDLHGPYLPPREFLPSEFVPGDFYSYYRFSELSGRGVLGSPEFARHLRNLRQRYEGAVRFSDAEFGRLVEELRAAGRWDESLVWVLSDHGESFGEHDHAGHGGLDVTTTLIQVPLLLKLPRSWGVPARVEATPVSTLDLLPTTLGLLGLEPPEPSFGRDWSELARGVPLQDARTLVSYAATYQAGDGAVIQVYSGIRWPWKLDLHLPRNGPVERRLFHLEQDPGEKTDLAPDRREIVASLEVELERWRARELELLLGPEAVEIDPRVREQLRNLGYVE
jgi:arylsulfatase